MKLAGLALLACTAALAQTPGLFVTVSGASFAHGPVAPNSIVSGFAPSLATETVLASAQPLPTTLGGVSVEVRDAAGTTTPAPLIYVSPTQINYVIPQAAAPGAATVTVRRGTNVVAVGVVQISIVAPSLFTARQSGVGPVAGRIVRSDSGQTFVELYGTGIRGAASMNNIQALTSGVVAPVLYAGPQGEYAGLDQVNIQLDENVASLPYLFLVLTVEGREANLVTIESGQVPLNTTEARFGPAQPFPTDALTVPDPTRPTGRRVNVPDCGPLAATVCAELNGYDGFSLQPRIAVRFSGPVDPHTIRDSVVIAQIDDNTKQTGIDRIAWDVGSSTLLAKPAGPLEPGKRYLLLVRNTLRDPWNRPVESPAAFTACVTTPADDYCRELAQALPSAENYVIASLFTTMTTTAWLQSARQQLEGIAPNPQRAGTVRLTGLEVATLRLQTGTNTFEDFSFPGLVLNQAGVDRVWFGTYRSPSFLNAQQTITANAPVSIQDLAFHAYLSNETKPAAGYPVVIFGHGLGDSRFGGPTLVAGTLAARGYVTLAVNAVGHGSGPLTTLRLTSVAGTTEIAVPGRGVDVNNDGRIESREGCLLLTYVALRDCLRQTAVDLMQLVRAVKAGIDLDGDGTNDLDSTRIYYGGQSLGAIYGTIFTAMEPSIRAANLNVGGASVVNIAMLSDSFGEFTTAILGTNDRPVLPLRQQPVKYIINTPLRDFLELLEWVQMPGDPTGYAHLLRGRPVMFQVARGDRTVPNPASANLVILAGGQDRTVLYRHDWARTSGADLSENPHAFLVDIRSLASAAIAQAAQAQMAGFFTSDGTMIPDPDSVVLRLLLGGRDVFQQGVVPLDPGF